MLIRWTGSVIMIINHNLNAIKSHRFMGINSEKSGRAMEKLTVGKVINSFECNFSS